MNTTNTSDREFVVTRVVSAPRELVWEAMTNPKHVVNWWGPRGFSCTIETLDVRVGGVWKQMMHGPDGADYVNEHYFQEVVKPERIVMSHGGHKVGGPAVRSTATWTFETVEGGKTKVTIHMVFPTADEYDRVVKQFNAIEGAQQTLARLDEFLPKLQTTTSTNHTMTSFISPYLNFDGRCDEALAFYQKAIGLKVDTLMRFKDCPDQSTVTPESREKVMHVTCTFGGTKLMASDGYCKGKGGFQGINLSLNVPDVATAHKYFAALSEGGQVQMPMDKTFFSPAFGMVSDKFGLMWMVHVPGQP